LIGPFDPLPEPLNRSIGVTLRASPVILYRKPESGKRWKDVNCGLSQKGKSLYSSFIYKLKLDFGRFFREACNQFWNVLLQEDTQVWKNDILMITGLQAYKTTRDALMETFWLQ
jgi:hypothetical protein